MVLALTMNDFSGHKAGTTVVLDWKESISASGTSFAVERSADGQLFSTIGTVDGESTIGGGNMIGAMGQYSFTDMAPNTGKNYYRIEAIDGQGKADLFFHSDRDLFNRFVRYRQCISKPGDRSFQRANARYGQWLVCAFTL